RDLAIVPQGTTGRYGPYAAARSSFAWYERLAQGSLSRLGHVEELRDSLFQLEGSSIPLEDALAVDEQQPPQGFDSGPLGPESARAIVIIQENLGPGQAQLLDQTLGPRAIGLVVEVDADYLEAVAMTALVELLELGHLGHARRAPCRPAVDEQDL